MHKRTQPLVVAFCLTGSICTWGRRLCKSRCERSRIKRHIYLLVTRAIGTALAMIVGNPIAYPLEFSQLYGLYMGHIVGFYHWYYCNRTLASWFRRWPSPRIFITRTMVDRGASRVLVIYLRALVLEGQSVLALL